jgi:hypothetical protein
MMALGKLKAKYGMGNKETRRFREQVGPSRSGRSAEDKMDDMEKINDLDECIEENCTEKEKIEKTNKNVNSVGVWKMYFDGASSCEGEGVGVLFVAPRDEFIIPFSYRLQWDIDYTNNVCEYEALVLGLEAARKLKIENLIVYGDAELIVKQIKQ